MLKKETKILFLTLSGKTIGIAKDFFIVFSVGISSVTDSFYIATNISTLLYIMVYNSIPILIASALKNNEKIDDYVSLLNSITFLIFLLALALVFFLNSQTFIFLALMSITYFFSTNASVVMSKISYKKKSSLFASVPLMLNLFFILLIMIFQDLYFVVMFMPFAWLLIYVLLKKQHYKYLDEKYEISLSFSKITKFFKSFRITLPVLLTYLILYLPYLQDDNTVEGFITTYNIYLKLIFTMYTIFQVYINSLYLKEVSETRLKDLLRTNLYVFLVCAACSFLTYFASGFFDLTYYTEKYGITLGALYVFPFIAGFLALKEIWERRIAVFSSYGFAWLNLVIILSLVAIVFIFDFELFFVILISVILCVIIYSFYSVKVLKEK